MALEQYLATEKAHHIVGVVEDLLSAKKGLVPLSAGPVESSRSHVASILPSSIKYLKQ